MAETRRRVQGSRRAPLTRNDRLHRILRTYVPDTMSHYDRHGGEWPSGSAPYVFDEPPGKPGLVRLRITSEEGDSVGAIAENVENAIAAMEKKLDIPRGEA